MWNFFFKYLDLYAWGGDGTWFLAQYVMAVVKNSKWEYGWKGNGEWKIFGWKILGQKTGKREGQWKKL